MSFKVTRLGPPRIKRDTITVGGTVFTADDLANPTVVVAITDLTDVDLTGLADGDVLIWDAGTNTWIVGQLAGGEVLMADGLTNPPDPVTNEAGDDWLYSEGT